ncbi:PD40 domain-containing protein [Candidatus Poribacteria bacterium]|nr:PD40 domain-containing protein [Candidatus Poribacteria bacterium]
MHLKNKNLSIYLILFLVSTFYLPNAFAQNPTRWGLPEGAIARFGKGPATGTIAFSPDGTQFAIGWKTGIWIYNTKTYQEVALFTMDGISEIRAFAFSPDGKTLAGSGGNETRLWDLATKKHKQTINATSSHITFSPDSQTLAIGKELWDASTGGHLKRWQVGSGGRVCSAFSPDGQMLVGCYDTNIFLWNILTDQSLWLKGHRDWSGSVAFSPNGQIIASGSPDNTIRLWDAATGQIKNILTDHRGDVNSVVFTPDGSTLLSGSEDKTIRLWDVATGLQKEVLTGHSASIYSIALSPDGSTLMSGSNDNAIYFWDVATGERLEILRESAAGIDDIAFSPDNTIIATELGRDILLWDIATGVQKQTLTGHTESVNSIVFSPDGVTLASGSQDDTVRVWDVTTGQIQKILTEHGGDIRTVVFSPDGGTLAGATKGNIYLWDVATGIRKQTLAGGRNSSIAFSPDGRTLVSGSGDTSIRLWDVATGLQKQTFTGHGGDVASVAFSSDGSILVSGSSDTTIRLWNVATGQHLKTLVGHTRTVSSLSFSFDGRALTSGSPDGTLRFWDALTGEHLETQETPIPSAHRNNIAGISLSPNGSMLASGSGDGIVFLWSVTPLSVEVDPATRPPAQAEEDVNADGVVNIQDLVLVASNFGETGENVADVNGDDVVNIEDLVKVAGALVNDTAAPAVWSREPEIALTRAEVHRWLQEAKQINLTDPDFQRGVVILEQLLTALTPKETTLLPNYPNPFNPETWIPYQLAEPADVTVSIHSVAGKLVRTLTLGHHPAGIYQNRSRAVYWDGRNQLGEPVASGVYFYTLTAGEFTATRKMLIRK